MFGLCPFQLPFIPAPKRGEVNSTQCTDGCHGIVQEVCVEQCGNCLLVQPTSLGIGAVHVQ